MGAHDDYGTDLLRAAAGRAYVQYGTSAEVDYGIGKPVRIDGATGPRPVETSVGDVCRKLLACDRCLLVGRC